MVYCQYFDGSPSDPSDSYNVSMLVHLDFSFFSNIKLTFACGIVNKVSNDQNDNNVLSNTIMISGSCCTPILLQMHLQTEQGIPLTVVLGP